MPDTRLHRISGATMAVSFAVLYVSGTCISYSQTAKSRPVDDYIEQWMRDRHIPGLSVAVVRSGSLVEAKGYGMANLETRTPATPDTVYKTASLSKMFVADAILLLVQEGKIALDDKVSRYLDGTPETWKEITVRNLLNHTSGIVRDPPDYYPYREQPLSEVVEAVYPEPLKFQPGEGWLYSNVGYYALAEIITKASGKPWDEFIAERLFAPAHMNSTRTTTVTDIVPNRANGYKRTDRGQMNAENWIAVRPSGAFLSTVLDMAKWDSFLDRDNPVTETNRRLAWTQAILKDGTTADYGFGWAVDSYLTHTRIHHNGQFPGFRSDYERLDDGKLTVIVLANSDNADLDPLALKIASFYDPAFTTPPFTLSANAPADVRINGNPLAITITAKDEGIAAPNSVVEMEIWDAAGKPVYKQHQTNEDFTTGQTHTFNFSWTPTKAGRYTVNVGVYGPRWVPSYAWKLNAAVIAVE